ncbi:hypothetical protein EGW08_004493, partial [Elysia chlorotica]
MFIARVTPLVGLLLYVILVADFQAVRGQDEKLLSTDILKSQEFRSRTLAPNKGVHCVSYYARTWQDNSVANLQTRLENADTGKTTLVFPTNNHLTLELRLVFFEIPEQTKPFKVVIEKAAGNDQDASVAIVDVEVTEGPCLDVSGSCDFERDQCHYSSSGNFQNWTRTSGLQVEDSGVRYPAVDSTIGSGVGQYMKVHLKNERDTAQLTSHILQSSKSCLRFSYSILGDGKILVSILNGPVLSTISNTDSSLKTSSLGWREAEVDISLKDGTKDYRLNFTAMSGGTQTWIALDDIKVLHNSCYSLPAPIEPEESAIIAEGSCDFDSGCADDWKPDQNNMGYTWKLRTGKTTHSFPKFDHTHGDSTS